MKIRTSVYLDPETIVRIETIRIRQIRETGKRTSQSEVIDEAVKEYFENE